MCSQKKGDLQYYVHFYVCHLQALTVTQIKKIRTVIDERMAQCNAERADLEKERDEALREIGNMIHESCIVSADEVCIFYLKNPNHPHCWYTDFFFCLRYPMNNSSF